MSSVRKHRLTNRLGVCLVSVTHTRAAWSTPTASYSDMKLWQVHLVSTHMCKFLPGNLVAVLLLLLLLSSVCKVA